MEGNGDCAPVHNRAAVYKGCGRATEPTGVRYATIARTQGHDRTHHNLHEAADKTKDRVKVDRVKVDHERGEHPRVMAALVNTTQGERAAVARATYPPYRAPGALNCHFHCYQH